MGSLEGAARQDGAQLARRLLRGRGTEAHWSRPALAVILVLTAVLYTHAQSARAPGQEGRSRGIS